VAPHAAKDELQLNVNARERQEAHNQDLERATSVDKKKQKN
jgi:hypothetical protein